MVLEEEGVCEGSPTCICRVHAMVNVDNVTHWFRDATSDSRIDVLCRLLECCMPLELQFLGTYLEGLLQRNMVFNQPSETITSLYSNLKDLKEITNSNFRRQLCVLLTRLKSTNRILAYNIYDILIQYDFAEFFSRVISMEEELVDEILLLFTLAANHPAMSFSQRRHLQQRLAELRGTIEDSFECHHVDVCSLDDHQHLCTPLESENTTKRGQECRSLPEPSTTQLDVVTPTAQAKYKNAKETRQVHIKDLKIVKIQQRPYDNKYEYIFEVTWTNGRVVEIRRGYGELFDFQCKLRRFSKEGNKVSGKRIIPYLPPRKSIKYCEGNDVLPDISNYVREFAQMPDKLLHSEWVENFFSDGDERNREQSSLPTSKSKQSCNVDRKESLNCVPRQTDTSRETGEIKSDNGNGVSKKNPPKAKCLTSITSKKSTNSHHASGKLEPKKRHLHSPKNLTIGTLMSSKERNKVTTIVNHPTEVSSKFLVSSSSRAPPDKTQIVKKENSKEKTHKTTDYNTSVSVTTTLPQKNFKAMNGDVHNACTEKVIPLVKVERDLDKTSTTASQTPLTVAVPIHSSVCTPCLASNLLSSDGSVTSSMSTSPLCSPATLFSLEPSRTSSQASSPDHHRVDFATMSCSPETNNRIRLLKLLELQRYETPFKDFNDEEVFELSDSNIDKLEMTETERQNLKASMDNLKLSGGFGGNGFSVARHSMSQHGLLIVPNGYTNSPSEIVIQPSENSKEFDKNCNYILQNGEYHRTVNFGCNEAFEFEPKTCLNQKSNGFCKPYCYNCGESGHVGHQCLETRIEEPSAS